MSKAIAALIAVIALAFIISCSSPAPSTQPENSEAPKLKPGQLVRHRMDGRIGIVLATVRDVKVRFSCNYTTSSNFEVIFCEPFELIPIAKEDEENLYWRRRERPPHSPDQTELP